MNSGYSDQHTNIKILEEIKQHGYLEIRLIPDKINDLSFGDLENIIKKNQIKHRGVFYPHIANHKFGKMRRIENYIESFYKWGNSIDIWRFYKSGQFKQFRSFVEDRWDDNPLFDRGFESEIKSPIPKTTFFEPIVKIWEMTEMFLFASKLAKEINCKLIIKIKLHNMENRHLEIRSGDRFRLFDYYTCHTNIISLNPISVSIKTLDIQHDKLAAEKMLEILDYFSWNANHIPSIIKEEQKKFYSHHF